MPCNFNLVPRNVDAVTGTESFSHKLGTSSFSLGRRNVCRKEGAIVVSVQRHIQHSRIVDKHFLGTVSMMNVPINQQNPTKES
jgi:hypothetical protein